MKKTASTLLLAGLLTLPIGAQEVIEEAASETKQEVNIEGKERGRHGKHSKLCACQAKGEKSSRGERFKDGRRAKVAPGIRRAIGERRAQIGEARKGVSEFGSDRGRSREIGGRADRAQARRGAEGRRSAEGRRGAKGAQAKGRKGGECKQHGEKGRGRDEIRSRIGRLGDRLRDSGRSRGGDRGRLGSRGGEHPRRFEGRR